MVIDFGSLFANLYDKSPWGVRRGVGTFLTMEFGAPESPPRGTVAHGEWHLWLYFCDWRLESDPRIVTGSNDEGEVIDAALQDAKLGKLQHVELSQPFKDLVIQFESGHRLRTFSSSSDPTADQWKLYMPDGNCLIVGGSGSAKIVPRI